MGTSKRLTAGIPALDDMLGGGFIPGKKVVVYGSTGVGKSILGVTVAHAGIEGEGHPGMLIDISTGADEQSQLQYAYEMMNWNMRVWAKASKKNTPEELSDFALRRMKLEEYHAGEKSRVCDDFLRHHLPRTQRLIIDGSEQYETAKGAKVIADIRKVWAEHEAFSHVVLYKHPFQNRGFSPIDNEVYWNWVVSQKQIDTYITTGKDKFKFGFASEHRTNEEERLVDNMKERNYDIYLRVFLSDTYDRDVLQPNGPFPVNMLWQPIRTSDDISVFLQTTQERNIFDLINRSAEAGSLDAEVNTVLVMGYFPVTEANTRQRRGLAVVKHRGSNYDSTVVEYKITGRGIAIGK